ncbi:hypothetical protein B566_EDAN001010 [Ephemera danica]|nr:hypothetical protein B566_EDAN001010 [Ephemera danica]
MASGSIVPAINSSTDGGGSVGLEVAEVGPGVQQGPAPPAIAFPGIPPDSVTPPLTPVDRCHHAVLDLDYQAATAVICGMYLVFGVVYSIFGYRCFKAVMFLTGFIFGSIVVYLICLQEKLLPDYGNAALGAGLLFGLITMLVQYVGLFMTGFHTGLFLALIGLAVAEPFYRPASVWLTAAIMLGGGLLLAVLNLACQKGLTILGTSLYGGAILATALDYFVEKFYMRVALRQSDKVPCWFSWAVLAVWPVVVTLGLFTQTIVTGRGIHHQEMVPSKHVRGTMGPQRVIRTREQRAEIRQKKYRYLYQVRTAHGDVISQTQLAALTESEDDSRSMMGLDR